MRQPIRRGQQAILLGLVGLGTFIRFRAGAVVVASGGWHKAFWPNTGMRDLSGDGIAAASRIASNAVRPRSSRFPGKYGPAPRAA
mgnify:CR=1 FL=1